MPAMGIRKRYCGGLLFLVLLLGLGTALLEPSPRPGSMEDRFARLQIGMTYEEAGHLLRPHRLPGEIRSLPVSGAEGVGWTEVYMGEKGTLRLEFASDNRVRAKEFKSYRRLWLEALRARARSWVP